MARGFAAVRKVPRRRAPHERGVSEFVRAAALGDVPPGQAIAVIVGDWEVGLFNIDGAIYAIDNICPHQGAPLSEGWIEGATVTCPWHAWCFDLRTGALRLGSSFDGIDRFEVRVEGGDIFVSTEPSA
jgi:nitrite reductase/ring-hydroxylating ferredoxin subunit